MPKEQIMCYCLDIFPEISLLKQICHNIKHYLKTVKAIFPSLILYYSGFKINKLRVAQLFKGKFKHPGATASFL